MERPAISTVETGQELQKWYWLKSELIALAKERGVNYGGSKFEILDRLSSILDGKPAQSKNRELAHSTVNWANSLLTLDTEITDSYTNSQNVRSFFVEYCGDAFKFSIPFMKWMKENKGKKLKDAVNEWKRLQQIKKEDSFASVIPVGNQYNQYMRDFFANNPACAVNEARHFWKLKRQLPLGRHVYEQTDLELRS